MLNKRLTGQGGHINPALQQIHQNTRIAREIHSVTSRLGGAAVYIQSCGERFGHEPVRAIFPTSFRPSNILQPWHSGVLCHETVGPRSPKGSARHASPRQSIGRLGRAHTYALSALSICFAAFARRQAAPPNCKMLYTPIFTSQWRMASASSSPIPWCVSISRASRWAPASARVRFKAGACLP